LARAEDLPAPLVVVDGGWDSCVGTSPFGGNSTKAGVQMINDLTNYYKQPDVNWRGMSDHGIRWLFSCFTSTSELYLRGNQDPDVVGGDAWDLNPLLSRIQTLSEDFRRPVIIIGHSHGGWLAMSLAEALPRPIANGFLATIDPISFTECNPSTYWDAAFNLNIWSGTAPCRQAPGDFTPARVERIRANLAGHQWKHYYQTYFAPLHSSDIPGGPDLSLDMSSFFYVVSGGAAASLSAHTRIADLSSIWFGLAQAIKNIYSPL
jgi:pimeloyl-ACP methyl ester carboxylesterase